MKKFAFLAICLSLCGAALAQGSKVTSFRDMVWGVHKDSIFRNGTKIKFIKDRNASEANTYTMADDNLTLGSAKLEKISYFFNKDNRFKKVILVGNKQYLEDVKYIVKYKFGTGKPSESGKVKIIKWQIGDVEINLTTHEDEDKFKLILESNWDISETFVKNMNVKDIPYDGKQIKGFRSLNWLDKKDSVYINGEKVVFTLDREASEPNSFYLDNDKSTIGSCRLSSINYVFNEDNQLNKVVLKGTNEYFDDFKSILINKLGVPKDVSTFSVDLSVLEWRVADTNVKLTDSQGGEFFTCIIESNRDKTQSYIKNQNVFDF